MDPKLNRQALDLKEIDRNTVLLTLVQPPVLPPLESYYEIGTKLPLRKLVLDRFLGRFPAL